MKFEKKLFLASLIFKNRKTAIFVCDADSADEVEKIITQTGQRSSIRSTFIVEVPENGIGRLQQ